MQQLDVHFGRQGGGVELLDHFHRGTGVAGQCQQVDVAAEDEAEGDGGVAQAVKAAVRAMRPGLQTQGIHDPVEQPADGVEGAQTVFFFRKKHIVLGAAKALRGVVFQHGFVHVHRLRQADRGRFVPLDLRWCEPQVVELAGDDFDVFVFQLSNVAGAQKRVDHEADQPVHLQGHAAVQRLDVKPGVGLVPHKYMLAQHLGLAQHGGVLC